MRVTDAERRERLAKLATAALRKNQERRYQMPWAEVVYDGLYNTAELQYATAVSPAFVLRLLKRAERHNQ